MRFIRCSKDQWNSGGPQEDLKQYDRDTLLGLRNVSASRNRPINLPDLPDIVLKTPLLGVGGSGGGGGPLQLGSSGPPPMGMSGGGGGMMMGGMMQGDKGMSTDWRNGNDPFSPFYVKSTRSLGGVTKRGSQQGKKDVKNINIHIPKEVKLKTSENAWTPSKVAALETEGDPDSVIKRVRSILNKLTPQNFHILLDQMESILIDTEEKLVIVTDLVFEKAVMEPNYSSAYAKFCKFLMLLRVPSKNNPEQIVNFRSLLLTTCQKEFERDNETEQKILDMKEKIEEAPEEKKKPLIDELQEVMFVSRRKSVGNIRFIGELFKMNMLTEKIMHSCLYKLSSTTDEEKLECMCKLLCTVGQVLEAKMKSEQVDQYFNNIQKIIDSKQASSRIRFMLLDLIDLRKNRWVPRRAEKGPKTLEELHQDIQNEEIEHRQKMDAAANQLTSLSSQRNRGGRAGSMGPPAPPQANDGDGWNTVGGRPLRAPPIEPNKMWLPKSKIDDTVQLCPGVGATKFSAWARGSTGGSGRGSSSHHQQTERLPAPANRFSALSGGEEEDLSQSGGGRGGQENRPEMFGRGNMGGRRDGPRPGVRPSTDSLIRSNLSGSRGKTVARRFSQEDRNSQRRGSNDNLTPLRGQTREDSRSRKIRSRENSRNRSLHTPISSRENSQNRQSVLHSRENSRDARMYSENGMLQDNKMQSYDSNSAPHEYHLKQDKIESIATSDKPLSDEEVQKKATAIIDEYLNIKDKKEAVQCVIEMKSLTNLHVFVSTAISHILDLTQTARSLTGSLFYYFIESKIISHSVYLKGLMEVMEYAEDLEIDVPRIWTYLAEVIAPLLGEEGLPWTSLKEICEPLKASNKGGIFIAEIMKTLASLTAENKVQENWVSSGLKLSDFYDTEDMSKFIKEQKLEFILDKDSPESLLKNFENKLYKLLQDTDVENGLLLELIEKDLHKPLTETEEFIRILMTEICSSAIVGEGGCAKVWRNNIKIRCAVLVKYLGHKPELQLQALYALQALDLKMEHPPNVLRIMFEILYDEDVILEDAYFQWEKSDGPAGKGVALKQVVAFLNWLHEAEEDDDD